MGMKRCQIGRHSSTDRGLYALFPDGHVCHKKRALEIVIVLSGFAQAALARPEQPRGSCEESFSSTH
jgi:hypothetical protein